MGPYKNFISFHYDDSFHVRVKGQCSIPEGKKMRYHHYGDHGMDALIWESFVNLIAIAMRSKILTYMRSSGPLKRYFIERVILELHKLREVILEKSN